MRIRVKANLPDMGPSAGSPEPDYPLRPLAFMVSLAVHALLVAGLLTLKLQTVQVKRPVYNELIKPYEHKIVYYSLRRKTPDVAPQKRLGNAPDPRGAEVSKQAIVAALPAPKSSQMLISIPAPKLEIHQDVPVPLVVMKFDTSTPIPTAAPKPEPKRFVPQAPSKQDPSLAMHTPVLDMKAPSVATPVVPELPVPNLNFSQAIPLPKKAPEALEHQIGNAKADVAMASLHPKTDPGTPVPDGARAGRFSKAPVQGEAASGAAPNSAALTVPDLTVRNPRPEETPPTAVEEIIYRERVRNLPMSTMSVPLRPSSRSIPAAVDAQFNGRNVYTIVIPMERITAYAGDWILWFAERAAKAGETPVVRAPVPYKKLERISDAQAGGRARERIQFSATLKRNGRLDGIKLITPASPAVERAVFADITSWEFQAASCDGLAVDVDVVFEIPFSLPASIARGM